MQPFMKFFKKSKCSGIVEQGGPDAGQQLEAMAQGKYWIVLNTHLLVTNSHDERLCVSANAIKAALQTYGPVSNKLPDFRHNTGKARGHIFHGHAHDSGGTTYVCEWTVVDPDRKIIALLGFDTHENYRYQQKPLTPDAKQNIFNNEKNVMIMERSRKKIEEAKEKVERVLNNYRYCVN